MTYKNRADISVRESTKAQLREAKDDLGLTYDEAIQKMVSELTND